MTKLFTSIFTLALALSGWAQSAPNAGWAMAIPATNTMDVAAVHCLPNGNLLVAGSFGGQLWPSTEAYYQALALGNMFVLEYAPDRTLVRTSILYADGPGQLNSIVVDTAGNRYVCGRFSSVAEIENLNIVSAGGNDIFILKINAQGNAVRLKRFGGTLNDEALSLALSPNGQTIYLAGHYNSPTLSFGSTQLTSTVAYPKAFLARLDTAFNVLSARTVQSSTDDCRAQEIAVDADGHVFTALNFKGSLQLTAQSGTVTSTGGTDVHLAAWNAGLTEVNHEIQVTGAGNVLAARMAVSTNGKVHVCGNYSGSFALGNLSGTSNGLQDVFAVRLDSTLVPQWAIKGGGTLNDEAGALHLAADGKIYFAGTFQGLGQFGIAQLDNVVGLDGFVLALNPNGTLAYALQPGDQADEWAKAVCTNGTGGVFVAGMFNGPTTLANMPLTVMQQADDAFLMAYGVPAPQSVEEQGLPFAFYPNPCADVIHVSAKNEGAIPWQITDLQGKVLMSGRSTQNIFDINTEPLGIGAYVVRLFNTQGPVQSVVVKN